MKGICMWFTVFASQLLLTVQDHQYEENLTCFDIQVLDPKFFTNSWLIANAPDKPDQILFLKNITEDTPLQFDYTLQDAPYAFQSWTNVHYSSFAPLCDARPYARRYNIGYFVRQFLGIYSCPVEAGSRVHPGGLFNVPRSVYLHKPINYDLRRKRLLVNVYGPDEEMVFTGNFYIEPALPHTC